MPNIFPLLLIELSNSLVLVGALAVMLVLFIGAIQSHKKNKQILDKLQVERERGITVKVCTDSKMTGLYKQE